VLEPIAVSLFPNPRRGPEQQQIEKSNQSRQDISTNNFGGGNQISAG